MYLFVILGLFVVGALALTIWSHIQSHQEWKQEQREKEEIDEKVRVMIYGEKNDG